MAAFSTLDDLDAAGRRALVRVDLNVPMNDGRVSDATRIEIAKDDIEITRPAKISVMPENVLKDLSLTDIADLFAFLETSKNNAEPAKTTGQTSGGR